MNRDNKFTTGDTVWIEAEVKQVDAMDDGTIIYRLQNKAGSYRALSWYRETEIRGMVAEYPASRIDRSDTAIERRLVALERAIDDVWSTADSDLLAGRVATLERQMAALRSLFHNAGNV